MNVPSNGPTPDEGQGAGRQRSERLRARRTEAGLAQVSGWVPRERRAYARELLAALARGANSLPPDPEQMRVLEAARADAEAAKAEEGSLRAALAQGEQRERALAAELDAARGEAARARDQVRTAEAAALAQAQAAEHARADAERFRNVPGLRGRAIRWLASRPATKGPADRR